MSAASPAPTIALLPGGTGLAHLADDPDYIQRCEDVYLIRHRRSRSAHTHARHLHGSAILTRTVSTRSQGGRDDHGVHAQRRYHVAHWAFRSSEDRSCDGDEYCRRADNEPSVQARLERDERLARDVRVAREVLRETLRAA